MIRSGVTAGAGKQCAPAAPIGRRCAAPQLFSWASCVIALSLAVLSAPASAYCVGDDATLPSFDPNYYSVPTEAARSRYVVAVRVQEVVWFGDGGKPTELQPQYPVGSPLPRGFSDLVPYIGWQYTVVVTKTYRGNPPATLRLFSENSNARFLLNVGARYLFFVSDQTFDPPMGKRPTVDICGNSSTLEVAAPVISALTAPVLGKHKSE